MADQDRKVNTHDDDRESSGGPSRWARVILIVLAVLVLLFVAVQLVGGGHQIPQH